MSQNVTNSENTVIDARMAIAAELLANPDFSGTKSDIAREAGVTSRTLYRWLRNPDFVALVNQLVAQLRTQNLQWSGNRSASRFKPETYRQSAYTLNCENVANRPQPISCKTKHPNFMKH